MEKQKEIYGIIYVIRNKVNNKLYIGQTASKKGFDGRYNFKGSSIEKVYKHHKSYKDRNKNYNVHLLNSIEKYGFDAFEVDKEFDIAYSKKELDKLEDMYIKIYNCIKNGYNHRGGGANGKLSNETKEKLRYSQLEEKSAKSIPIYCYEFDTILLSSTAWQRVLDIDSTNIIQCCKNKAKSMDGFHFRYATQEEIMSYTEDPVIDLNIVEYIKYENKTKKSIFCEEFGQIRYTAKEWGNLLNCQGCVITNCCTNNSSFLGFHFRYATKEEIESYNPSTDILTKEEVEEQLLKNIKVIYCKEYDSFQIGGVEWGEIIGVDGSQINSCCKGRVKHVKGLHFRYATEEEKLANKEEILYKLQIKRNKKSHKTTLVYCVELNETKPLTVWSKELNINISGIIRSCKKENRTCGGYHFRYFNN